MNPSRFRVLTSVMILCCALIILAGCDEEKNPTTPEQSLPDPNEYFPHVSGSYWIYSVNGAACWKLSLEGVYQHPQAGETQILEEYYLENGVWKLCHQYYLKVTDSEVRLYQYAGPAYLLMLKIPPIVGDTWGYYSGVGSDVEVVSEESITVPTDTYSTSKVTYHLHEDMHCWFTPGIGSIIGVKNYGWFRDIYDREQTAELSYFHLEPQ